MVQPVLALAVLLAGGQVPDDPALVIRHATAAIEGDSAAAVRARWSRRITRDPSDRLATLGVATLAQLAYEDTTSERLYRSLLPAPGAAGDRTSGYAALQLTRQYSLRGQWLRADSLGRLAIALGRAAHDSALTGEALAALGTVRTRTAGAAASLPLFDSADATIPATELRVRALSRCGRAQALSFAGDARALAEAAAGFALAEQSRDFRTRASCRAVGAGELTRRGDLDSAIVAYWYLVAEYRVAHDRAGLAVALQWRAHLYRQIGWIAKARRDAEEAIVEAESSGVRVVIPWALTTLAGTALQLGDLGRAAPAAAEATRLFLEQGDRYAATVARGLQGGVAVASGDWAAARTAYADALERAVALGWAESEINCHRMLMHLALRQGDLVTATNELAAADKRARAAKMEGYVNSDGYFQGVLDLRAGRLDRAERMFQSRMAHATRAQPQWNYLTAARLAEVLVLQGKNEEALHQLEAASKALDDWRLDLRDRQLRLYALQLSEDQSDPDLGVATVVAAIARSSFSAHYERTHEVFNLVESIRARDLADRLTRAAATSADSGDRAVRSVKPVTLAELMEVLPDDSTALLRYVTGSGGEPTTVIVVTWREYTTHQLPPEDSLAPAIARFAAFLESGDDAPALAEQLGTALLAAAVAPMPPSIRRIVIVPDGVLNRVPFDALSVRGQRVLERFSISYAPSATVAAALWQPRRLPGPGTALVLADPRFAHETDQPTASVDVFRGAVGGRGGLPRLRGSAREARAVARYSPSPTVRRRAAASEAWLKKAPLKTYGVLHFATHALVDEGSMTNTALALAPGEGEDGFVNEGELLALSLSADMVVLSACRTAGGVLVRGEGVQGLGVPLLVAGARSIVATWWPIGDEASVKLVDDFYRGLAMGAPAGDALRSAKLAALKRGAPAREWAAFTLIGDPMVHPALQLPHHRLPVVPIITGAAAVLLLAYGAMRRRRTVDAG